MRLCTNCGAYFTVSSNTNELDFSHCFLCQRLFDRMLFADDMNDKLLWINTQAWRFRQTFRIVPRAA